MKRCFLFIFALLSIHLTAFAQTPLDSWYVGVRSGVVFPTVDDHHFVDTGEGWPNDEYYNHHTGEQAAFSFLTGYQWATGQSALPFYSLGARYTYALPIQVEGTTFQYGLPQFENYRYTYHLQRQTLLGTLKANVFTFHQFLPYVTGGLGFSVNRFHRFQETPLPFITPRISPGFSWKTKTDFSYVVGGGVDYAFNDTIWLGLDYEYGRFGAAQSGFGTAGYAAENLHTDISASTVSMTLHYFLG